MRVRSFVLSAVVVGALGGGARGVGTIDTTGATIAIGTAPTMGTLTSDAGAAAGPAPSIPAIAPLGSIGAFSSTLPAFPGGGTGAAGVFVGSGAVVGAGGTLSFSSYTVNAGAVVTYPGAVTILTTGDVAISGTIQANGPITFRCAGGFTMGGLIRAQGAGSDVTIDVAGAVLGTNGGRVETTEADIDVIAHGLGVGGDVTLAGFELYAKTSGDIRVRASGSITTALDGFVYADSGDIALQAFAGVLSIGDQSYVQTGAGAIVVESRDDATFGGAQGGEELVTGAGPISVTSFDGDVLFPGGTARVGDASDVTLRAAGSVRFSQQGKIVSGGDATVTAFGGDADFQPLGGGQYLTVEGDMTIAAAQNVFMSGAATYEHASFRVRAVAGDVTMKEGIHFDAAPLLDVRAAGAFRCTFGFLATNVPVVAISAGAGGVALGQCLIGTANQIDVVARGPVTAGLGPTKGANIVARGPITLTSCDGGVNVENSTISTLDVGGTSASITVQSFADAAGVIDLGAATVRTGNATTRSGDIRLLVHQAKTTGGGGGPGTPVDSFLLPTSWTTKVNAKNAAMSKLTAAGVIDLGSAGANLNAAATFDVGAFHLAFPAPTTKGRKLVYSVPGATLTLTPNAKGGSRVGFALSYTGDVTSLPADGQIDPCYRTGSLDARGTIVVAGGKFALTRAAGRLIEPCYFPQSVAATIKGGGRDSLAMFLGIATDGTVPAGIIPCIKVSFGPTFTADIPQASFKPKGQTFTFKGNVLGVTNVTVDFAKGRVTVKGNNMDLGSFADGRNAVTITVVIDQTSYTMSVGLVKAGAKLTY